MPNEEEFLSILWANIVGDTREQLLSLSWKGAATFILDQAGQMVITSLVPAGLVVAPIFGLFVNTVGRALDKTYEDWGEMEMRLDKSGIAILEKPVLQTTPPKKYDLPQRIELPSTELIKPGEGLRLNPSVGMQRSRLDYFQSGRQRRETRLERSPQAQILKSIRDRKETPQAQILSRYRRATRPELSPRAEPIVRSYGRRSGEKQQSTTTEDILYPDWAFTGILPESRKSAFLISISAFERLQKTERETAKKAITTAATQKRNQALAANVRNAAEQSIKRSQDLADRSRKQQERLREEQARLRRSQQQHRPHKK